MKEMIVAVGLNDEIGQNNRLLWKQREDMRHFKKTTMGKNVVMGRKTFDSLYEPLKGRKNYVLSQNIKMSSYEDGTYVEYLTYEEFIAKVDDYIVIGGSEIFEMFKDEVEKVHLTVIFEHFPEADTHFKDFTVDKFKAVEKAIHMPDEHNEHFAIVYELERLN